MAMLAEPRRKQRIGQNPRGKFFTDDDDNRGRQMLMKMGWKTGDGLGTNNRGMKEPIKPKMHTDARGLGYDKKTDPWVAHNEEFEQLLKNLNSSTENGENAASKDNSEDSNSECLERKSKGSRSRIHYHKFVKNKDLSRATSKDMSCIFGKQLNEKDNWKELSMESFPVVPVDETANTNSDAHNLLVDANDEVEGESNCTTKKKKKKKRSKENECTENVAQADVEGEIQQVLNDDKESVSQVVEERKKKKKSKKNKKHKCMDEQVECDTDNECIEKQVSDSDKPSSPDNDEDLPMLKDSLSETDGEGVSKKQKSKKRKRKNSVTCDVATDLYPASESSEFTEIIKKKKKKRQRQTDEEPVDVSQETSVVTGNEAISPSEPNQTSENSEKVESFGSMQFINRGSLEDYFKNKRMQMLNRLNKNT